MKPLISIFQRIIHLSKTKWFQKNEKYIRLFILAMIVNTLIFFFLPVLNLMGIRDNSELKTESIAVKVSTVHSQKKKVQKKKKKMKSKQKSHKVVERTTASDERFELNLETVSDASETGDSFGDLIYEEGDVDSGPTILQNPGIKYPIKALEFGKEGTVELKLTIGITGEVQDIKVISENPKGYGFVKAAVEGFMKWKFTPAKVKGIPVRCYRYIRFNFEQN